MDVSGAAPVYEVTDIHSPYGIMRDTIPIPGPVVQAMSESISELSEAFAPAIVIGPPTSITVTVDERRGYSEGVPVTLSNGGAYGSILDAQISTQLDTVTVNPTEVGGLSLDKSGAFQVMVNALNMDAGSYTTEILVQDDKATNSPQVLAVSVVVRPKASITTSLSSLNFYVANLVGAPFPPIPAQHFTITNTGPSGSVLDYQIQRLTGLSPWLASFSPPVGTLQSGEFVDISVLVMPPANTGCGTYTEILRVSGYSDNMYTDIQVTLVIS